MNLTLTIPESTQPPITVEVGGTTELTSYVAQVAGLPDYPSTFPPAIGSAANQAVAGNDPRLTNSRAPTAHKSTHATGGSDALTPADIGAMANTNAAVNAVIEEDPAATREAALTNKRLSLARITQKLSQSQNITNTMTTATVVALGDSMASRAPVACMLGLVERYGRKGLAMDSVHYSLGSGAFYSGPNSGAPENWNWCPTGKYFAVDAGERVDFADSYSGTVNYILMDRLTVYGVRTAGGGTYKVQTSPDGSTWTDVASIGPVDSDVVTPGDPDSAIISTASITRGSYRVRVLGVSGTSYFLGVKLWDSTIKGVIPCLLGRGGAESSNQTAWMDHGVWGDIAADINPDLIIFHNWDGPTSVATNFPDVVDGWTAATTAPASWSIFGQHDMEADPTYGLSQRLAVAKVAEAKGAHYFDTNAAYGGYANIIALNFDDGDIVHLSDDAHKSAAMTWINETGLADAAVAPTIRRRSLNAYNQMVVSGNYNSLDTTQLVLESHSNSATEFVFGNTDTSGAPYGGNASWIFRRIAANNGSAPGAFSITGGETQVGRFIMDKAGRSVFATSTEGGYTWPRTERLLIAEATATISALHLHHESATPTTGRALKVTNSTDVETAFIRANGTAKLTLPVHATDGAAGTAGLATGELYQTSAGVVMIKQ
jgi:hypothetical protein